MRFWLLSLRGLSHLGWHGARGFSPVILLSLDVAFSTPPPLCPELCTCFHILKMQSILLRFTTLSLSRHIHHQVYVHSEPYHSSQLVPLGCSVLAENLHKTTVNFFLLTSCSAPPPTITAIPLTPQPPTLTVDKLVGWMAFHLIVTAGKVLMDICR